MEPSQFFVEAGAEKDEDLSKEVLCRGLVVVQCPILVGFVPQPLFGTYHMANAKLVT